MERLVHQRISPSLPHASHQHGFKPLHSTTTYLTNLTQTIAEGFNHKPPMRSALVTIDISKAFDTIPRHKLMNKILDLPLPPNDTRWLNNFISRRQAQVLLRNSKSSIRNFPNGVPQGAVLSPSLFNLFFNDLPTPSSPTNVLSYADDLSILS